MWWILGGGIAVMVIISLYFTLAGSKLKEDWENRNDDLEGN